MNRTLKYRLTVEIEIDGEPPEDKVIKNWVIDELYESSPINTHREEEEYEMSIAFIEYELEE